MWWGWWLALLLVVGLGLYPVSFGVTRAALVGAVVCFVALSFVLARRRKLVWVPMAVLLVSGVVFVLLPGRPVDEGKLRGVYVGALQRYEGARYLWGGENRLGIDCSGLVRQGYVDAHVMAGLKTLNPALVRRGAAMWWHDCSAMALRDGYRDSTRRLFEAESVRLADHARLKPGDLAVTADGSHVMAYLGDERWIEADPGLAEVVVLSLNDANPWLDRPVVIMRWTGFEAE